MLKVVNQMEEICRLDKYQIKRNIKLSEHWVFLLVAETNTRAALFSTHSGNQSWAFEEEQFILSWYSPVLLATWRHRFSIHTFYMIKASFLMMRLVKIICKGSKCFIFFDVLPTILVTFSCWTNSTRKPNYKEERNKNAERKVLIDQYNSETCLNIFFVCFTTLVIVTLETSFKPQSTIKTLFCSKK